MYLSPPPPSVEQIVERIFDCFFFIFNIHPNRISDLIIERKVEINNKFRISGCSHIRTCSDILASSLSKTQAGIVFSCLVLDHFNINPRASTQYVHFSGSGPTTPPQPVHINLSKYCLPVAGWPIGIHGSISVLSLRASSFNLTNEYTSLAAVIH